MPKIVPGTELTFMEGLPGGASGKELPANEGDVRDTGSIPGEGRSPGGGHGSPLQYSCLKNPMDRGVWQAAVHRFAESDTTQHRYDLI